ncbi:testis-specific serine/threonine-protein kinase 3-like [Melanaphis sacchari]|uniref:testis-specific serine/threonine-protein kinase 3-like n=1 Tax=Melanaphis sacchari TaxID=742174 RepID=UPI000DC14E08|nr:testis-specific serine/threonine-protein kinase 3-like [Melanaphis sacchari]
MEFAENGDLFTHLRNTVMKESQIRSWLVQILWAFMYMHSMGVVHRDLKCENILLTSNYNVRIADFGFARFVDRGRNPGADTLCGTLTYSSPELLYGKRPYNPVFSDVWAIGVVLFMMANNKAPFRDKTKEEIHRKQVSSVVMYMNKNEWENGYIPLSCALGVKWVAAMAVLNLN